LHLEVSESELEERRKDWTPIEIEFKTGLFARYAKLVSSAKDGTVLE
jgi:dihydroxy-acid dehydratase